MTLPISLDKSFVTGDVLPAATFNRIQNAVVNAHSGYRWQTFGLARAEGVGGTVTRIASNHSWTIANGGTLDVELPIDSGFLIRKARMHVDAPGGVTATLTVLRVIAGVVTSIGSASVIGGNVQFLTADFTGGELRLSSPQSLLVLRLASAGGTSTAWMSQLFAARDQNSLT